MMHAKTLSQFGNSLKENLVVLLFFSKAKQETIPLLLKLLIPL